MQCIALAQSPRCACTPGRRTACGLVSVAWALFAAIPGLAASGASPTAHDPDAAIALAPWAWRRMVVPVSGELLTVGIDATGRWLAVGHEGGVAWRGLDGAGEPESAWSAWQRVALSGAVTDVAFGPGDALFVASERGLWRIDPDGRRSEVSPAPGDEARRIHRVAITGGFVLAATDAGLFASLEGRTWARVSEGLPRAPAVAVAVRPQPVDATGARRADVRVVCGERLYSLALSSRAGVLVASPARRVDVSGWPASQAVADVVADVAGSDWVVLFGRALARSLEAGPGGVRFEVVYPVLAPGAQASRIVEVGGRVWLATDQGLLFAEEWPGRWRRASVPAGSAATGSVAGAGRRLYVAGRSGLLRGAPREQSGAGNSATGAAASAWLIPVDPDLRIVHEKALERAGLQPDYFRSLRRRLSRRGFLPELSLRAGAAYDRDTNEDYDEAFTSGSLRRLNDRYAARSRDFEGVVTLSWDLGDVVYHEDAPDLSREARQVITLRDTILDEINQLYFDRRRALAALARYADRRDPEAVELEIRCRELAAGLDAWTGGWFSAQLETRPPP